MAEGFRKNIYCEKEFLELCFLKSEIENIPISDLDEYNIWRNLKKMILKSDIKLHLNISKECYLEIKNKKSSDRVYIEKKIYEVSEKRLANGNYLDWSGFVINDTFFYHNDAEKLTSIYLSCQSSETCKNLMNDYGILAICPENIINFKGILYDNGGTIDKNESKGWKDLIKINPKSCNSMILIDNYIFSHSNTIDQKDNLLKILDILLPQSLNADITFHISIFTSDIDWDIKWQVESDEKIDKMSKIDKFYQMLAKSIERLRPNLCFLLCVFKCKLNEFHDRILVTNNFYISSGGGFDLIRKDGKSDKMTTTNIVYPYLNCSAKWVNSAYSNVISNAASVYNSKRLTKLKNESDRTAYLGNKINRLLKMI